MKCQPAARSLDDEFNQDEGRRFHDDEEFYASQGSRLIKVVVYYHLNIYIDS